MTDGSNKKSAFLGILMLDTQFERVLGDAGNPASYPFPARLELVEGAGSTDIVRDGRPSDKLVEAFIKAARKLETDGASALTSTCGFLITIQDEIASAVSIPVLVSALALYPEIKRAYPDGMVGILTASKAALGREALAAADIRREDVVINGMEDCIAFANAILRPKDRQNTTLDQKAIEKDIVAKAQKMLTDNPAISTFLLECGNLPPYQAAIAEATGRPVYSILDGVKEMVAKTVC